MKINSKSQIGIEYIIIVGFVTFILIGLLSLAFLYSGSIKDRIKLVQVNNFANKVLSSAETVFYYGEPSKATISVYLPEGVINITVIGRTLYIETQTSAGIERNGFQSKVPISGDITISPGIKKIKLIAEENEVSINKPS